MTSAQPPASSHPIRNRSALPCASLRALRRRSLLGTCLARVLRDRGHCDESRSREAVTRFARVPSPRRPRIPTHTARDHHFLVIQESKNSASEASGDRTTASTSAAARCPSKLGSLRRVALAGSVREARRVARRKRARPDRTPCPSKLGSLRRVALPVSAGRVSIEMAVIAAGRARARGLASRARALPRRRSIIHSCQTSYTEP